MKLPVGEFIALRDGNDPVHIGHHLQLLAVEAGFITHHADDGYLFSLGEMGFKSFVTDDAGHRLNGALRRARFHYNNHGIDLISYVVWKILKRGGMRAKVPGFSGISSCSYCTAPTGKSQ